MSDLVDNLFPDPSPESRPSAPAEGTEEEIVRIPGAILHLIDRHYSVELASGEFSVMRLRQGGNVVAVLARVGDEIQWPLAKDETAVKLDASHYFFSLRASAGGGDDDGDEILNYGLTIASKGKERLVRELDSVLESYSCFSVQKVSPEVEGTAAAAVATCPAEMKVAEGKSAAYWTTLAPNVEDYSGTAAKMIAAGSGHVVRGILWCGDVTVDRLKWGNEVMKRRMAPGAEKEVSPQTLRRIKR
jgi:spartin